MADKAIDESKPSKNRARTPVGQERKKSSPEIPKDKKPISPTVEKSVTEAEDNPVLAMKIDDKSDKEGNADDSKSPAKPTLEFTKGLRVEVKDLPTDIWYVAKVVDLEGSEVLIHYVNWAARHDEWISMDSNRIRALSESETPAPAPPVVTPVTTSRKRGRPGAAKAKPPPPAAATTASAETPEVEHKEENITFIAGEDVKALWSDSRKYPAKITEVLENNTYKVKFSDGFEKAMSCSKISKMKPGEAVASSPPPPLTPTTQEAQSIDDPDSKEGRRQRKRKINVAELFRRKTSTPKSNQSESPAPAPPKKPKLEEPEEPKPIMSPSEPSSQKRGRGRPPRKTLDSTGSIEVKQEPGDPEMDGDPVAGTSSAVETETPVKSTNPAGKKTDKKPSAAGEANKVGAAVPPVEIPLDVPEVPKELFIGSLKIERDGDNLKCPKDGCGKLLRKEKLIMMHIKHYHPELKKEMDVVPQVLDYAYARYIGDLPSTASMIRNFSNPVQSNSPATPSPVPKKKAVKTPVKAAPEPVKVEDPPPAAPAPSLTPRIQLGGKSNSSKSASKTGLKVKTLLPVRKSVPPKNSEPKDKYEPKKTLEMPVLKKALMTPPMNSSTPSKSEYSYKEEKTIKIHTPMLHKKSPRKSPRKDHLVEDGAMELINCLCGFTEEDGLIIQCDLCFCWQHGSCNGIEREEDVPDKFVCHVCKSPSKERKSRKYSHDQDWLKKGTLPRLPVLRLNEKFERSSLEKALKETQDIASATLSLGEVMHSMKIQINIAQKKDHPKLYLWSKEWQEIEKETLKEVTPPSSVVESIPMVPAKIEPVLPEIPVEAHFDPIPSTSTCGQTPVDDADLHPALKLPLSLLELEHLASTMAQSIPATEVAMETNPPIMLNPPKAPEPEAAIKPEKCRVMLLKHIQQLQDQLEARINELELSNTMLERRAPQIYGKDVSDARVKETLRMLQRDVGSVHKIGKYAKKG